MLLTTMVAVEQDTDTSLELNKLNKALKVLDEVQPYPKVSLWSGRYNRKAKVGRKAVRIVTKVRTMRQVSAPVENAKKTSSLKGPLDLLPLGETSVCVCERDKQRKIFQALREWKGRQSKQDGSPLSKFDVLLSPKQNTVYVKRKEGLNSNAKEKVPLELIKAIMPSSQVRASGGSRALELPSKSELQDGPQPPSSCPPGFPDPDPLPLTPELQDCAPTQPFSSCSTGFLSPEATPYQLPYILTLPELLPHKKARMLHPAHLKISHPVNSVQLPRSLSKNLLTKRLVEKRQRQEASARSANIPSRAAVVRRSCPPLKETFSCAGVGKFADDEECTMYYDCIQDYLNNLVATHVACPADTIFDPYIKRCATVQNYKKLKLQTRKSKSCKGKPSKAQNGYYPCSSCTDTCFRCTRGAVGQPESHYHVECQRSCQETNNCPYFTCPDVGVFADPEDCHKYFFCDAGNKCKFQLYHIRCPNGRVFDENVKVCVSSRPRPSRPCGGSRCKELKSCPYFTCKRVGFFPDKRNRHKYFSCELDVDECGFKMFHMTCPKGRVFDRKLRECHMVDLTKRHCWVRGGSGSGSRKLLSLEGGSENESLDEILRKSYEVLSSIKAHHKEMSERGPLQGESHSVWNKDPTKNDMQLGNDLTKDKWDKKTSGVIIQGKPEEVASERDDQNFLNRVLFDTRRIQQPTSRLKLLELGNRWKVRRDRKISPPEDSVKRDRNTQRGKRGQNNLFDLGNPNESEQELAEKGGRSKSYGGTSTTCIHKYTTPFVPPTMSITELTKYVTHNLKTSKWTPEAELEMTTKKPSCDVKIRSSSKQNSLRGGNPMADLLLFKREYVSKSRKRGLTPLGKWLPLDKIRQESGQWQCPSVGNYPAPENNTKYYQCGVELRPELKSCPSGSLFDKEQRTCSDITGRRKRGNGEEETSEAANVKEKEQQEAIYEGQKQLGILYIQGNPLPAGKKYSKSNSLTGGCNLPTTTCAPDDNDDQDDDDDEDDDDEVEDCSVTPSPSPTAIPTPAIPTPPPPTLPPSCSESSQEATLCEVAQMKAFLILALKAAIEENLDKIISDFERKVRVAGTAARCKTMKREKRFLSGFWKDFWAALFGTNSAKAPKVEGKLEGAKEDEQRILQSIHEQPNIP